MFENYSYTVAFGYEIEIKKTDLRRKFLMHDEVLNLAQ